MITVNNLYDVVLDNLNDKDAIHAFGVAVGNIHDIIYERYDGSVSYCDRNNNWVSINLVDEPDGIIVLFQDSRLSFYNDQLTTSMYDTLKNDSLPDQDGVNRYVDLLEFVNDFLIENNTNPEENWDYS